MSPNEKYNSLMCDALERDSHDTAWAAHELASCGKLQKAIDLLTADAALCSTVDALLVDLLPIASRRLSEVGG
jgi:hypothetical protein